MNCTRATSLMLDYLYGELTLRKRKSFEKHLRTCADCSRELGAHKATISTFSKLRMEEPSPEITERLAAVALRDIEQHELLYTKSRTYWKPVLAAVAVALIVGVSIVFYLPLASKSRMQTQRLAAVRQTEGIQESGEATGALAKKEVSTPKVDLDARSPNFHEKDNSAESRLGGEAKGRGALPGEAPAEKEQESEMQYSISNAPSAPSPASSPAENVPAENEVRTGASEVIAQAPREQGVASGSASGGTGATGSPRESMMVFKQPEKTKLADGVTDKLSEERKSADEATQREFSKGNEYFDNRDFSRAATAYEKAADLNPKSELAVEARYRQGQSFQQLRLYEKAIAAYDEIIKDHPDFHAIGDVYLAVGDCYMAMGRVEDALHSFEIVRDKFPPMREAAIQRIDLAVSQRKAIEKPDSSTPSQER